MPNPSSASPRAALAGGLLTALAAFLVGAPSGAQVTQILDASGDGAGHPLDRPLALAVDAAGNVYVAGAQSDNAFKIDATTGALSVILDAAGDGLGHTLDGPDALEANGSGDVFVTGSTSRNAFEISDPCGAGSILQVIDQTGDGAGHTLPNPAAIAVDAWDNAFVVATSPPAGPGIVFRITPAGGISTILTGAGGPGTGNFVGPTIDSIAVDGAGNVYATAWVTSNVFKVTPGGTITQILSGPGDGAGNTLSGPAGIGADAAGNVYVAGSNSHNVFRVAPDGTIAKIADVTTPQGIALDAAGNVYVTAQVFDEVFKIADPTGSPTVTRVLDASGDGLGHALDNPAGIAVDGAGNVWVTGADSDNVFRIEGAACAVRPRATFRNAGTNPASYAVDVASIGQELELAVDLSTTGHAMALVIGFDSPFELLLAGGQTLLCLDLLGNGQLLDTGFQPGPLAVFHLRVPNDPVLSGLELSTQAIHAFGVVPFALSNAQDIVIGGGCP